MSESIKASAFEMNYGFSPETPWSGIVLDNKRIHANSELVVKD